MEQQPSAAQRIVNKHLRQSVSTEAMGKLLLEARLEASQWENAYNELANYANGLELRVAELETLSPEGPKSGAPATPPEATPGGETASIGA